MTTNPFHLAVLVGSTREGRFGPTVARWFVSEASQRGDATIDVIDLADLELPVAHPARPDPGVAGLAQRIGRADGIVVVTPEYNHGYPASLKHAIDLLHAEWQAKPVGFVSYGGRAGGLRAVEQLRQVFAELHAMTVRDAVSFHLAWASFDNAGEPLDAAGSAAAAKAMLDQLAWWAVALRAGREARPYAA
ncbi:MAG: NADPH-dependent FMN reductase [Acidimicrobiia bacterium]|nr:NADPH-dependent FMN reductase [Acidimicrobiia bacterium]